jgi:hypothetical protein
MYVVTGNSKLSPFSTHGENPEIFYQDIFLYSFCDKGEYQMSEAPDVVFWHMSCLAICEDPSQICAGKHRIFGKLGAKLWSVL